MVYCPSCSQQKLSYFDTKEYKIEAEKIKKTNPQLYRESQKRIAATKPALYGWYPISEKNLPLKLPYLKNYQPSSGGESPLVNTGSWNKTQCPHCSLPAKRETDTMPNWAGSCWYFLRFASPNITPGALSNITPGVIRINKKLQSDYLPVDWYLGGAEHAVLHLLYARFWVHILNDLKILNFREPFLRLRNVGMVLASDHRKMSKSLGNVINPDEVAKKFGADTIRLYEMFMAPFSQEIPWSTNNLLGAKRFLTKVYQLYNNPANIAKSKNEEHLSLVTKLQTTIVKVQSDITNVKFNTAVSALMEFANYWQKGKLTQSNAQKYLKLLAPFAPFLAEEIWHSVYKMETSVHLEAWPEATKIDSAELEITLPITINNKVRALLKVRNNIAANEKEIVKKALAEPKVAKYLKNKKYRFLYIKNKILNFILL